MRTTPLQPDPFAATGPDPGGLVIPGVSLGETLGRGAFGSVYRGHHLVLDIPVAVKVIDAAFAPPQALDLALREARLMARLDHPNLVRIFDAGRLSGGLFLVLELMDGGSLEGARQLNEEALRSVARQALSGLQELHEARILHRDLKPANLLKRLADRRIKLGDLGIAMVQETRADNKQSAGTMPFMAPELWSASPSYSPRSDLYALGLSLACLALDRDPFPTDSLPSLLGWVQGKERPDLKALRPALSGDFCVLVSKLIDPLPERRHGSASEALAELQALPTPRASPSPSSPPPTPQRCVGAWCIGDAVWTSPNWESYTAHHCSSGAPARWAHAREGGATASAHDVIARGGALATSLDHPGFLPVLDWGELSGRPWVVTAPQGQSLIDLLATGKPLDELAALGFAVDLAEALAYLHGRGLVYQAVAPGSVFVRQDARSVQLGWPWFVVPAGTQVASGGKSSRAGILGYMAPEAFSASGTIDAAVDLWGLGEVFFLMLTGQSPSDPASSEPLAILASKLAPRRPLRDRNDTVTAPTALLAEALLSVTPGDRPAACDVARELRRIRRHLGAT